MDNILISSYDSDYLPHYNIEDEYSANWQIVNVVNTENGNLEICCESLPTEESLLIDDESMSISGISDAGFFDEQVSPVAESRSPIIIEVIFESTGAVVRIGASSDLRDLRCHIRREASKNPDLEWTYRWLNLRGWSARGPLIVTDEDYRRLRKTAHRSRNVIRIWASADESADYIWHWPNHSTMLTKLRDRFNMFRHENMLNALCGREGAPQLGFALLSYCALLHSSSALFSLMQRLAIFEQNEAMEQEPQLPSFLYSSEKGSHFYPLLKTQEVKILGCSMGRSALQEALHRMVELCHPKKSESAVYRRTVSAMF